MKLLSFLTLAAMLSISACSHHKKECAGKDKASCSKEGCKKACCEKEKKDCSGESCHKKS